jgi:hypothetical protein
MSGLDPRRESGPDHNIMSMTIEQELRESAIIEFSANDPAMPNRKLNGTIQSRANKTLTVTTAEEIPTSAEIRVQSKDLLTLGRVLHCISETDATWTVYVGIKRSILIV